MSARDLVVLGTASRAPTRRRNHTAALLRFDAERILFDVGEGTQRQLTLAGTSAARLTRVCITHFHGDHCLGLPGLALRLGADGVTRPVPVHYPQGEDGHFERLRHVAFAGDSPIVGSPVGEGLVAETPVGTLTARWLDHRVPTLGWRLAEPEGRRMLPEALDGAGVSGSDIGRLRAEGAIMAGGRRIALGEVSVPRPGQVFAYVMDTALCDAAYALAEGADMLVCEATYLDADAHLAAEHRHLTAGQAARMAAEVGVRHLVLIHLSERYPDGQGHRTEAEDAFDGQVSVPDDLDVIPLPRRCDAGRRG